MSISRLFISTGSVVLSMAVLGASESPGAAQVELKPCAAALTTIKRPAAPTGLRIIGSGLEALQEFISGPFVASDPPESIDGASTPTSSSYFEMLAGRPDCMQAHSLRSEEDLDSIPTRAPLSPRTGPKLPIVYDAAKDAALFQLDATGATPGSGSPMTPQKWVPMVVNHTSLLVTWDFEFDEGWRFKAEGEYINKHKTWLVCQNHSGAILILKTAYDLATKAGEGVAELMMTVPTDGFTVPGQSDRTSLGAEIRYPRKARFFMEPYVWTRYWMYFEGNIGGGLGGEPIRFSAWAADENRAPVQLYDRVPMYTPDTGLVLFRIAFDTSDTGHSTPLSKAWHRNFVALKGVTMADVTSLLQRPVK